MLRRTAFTLVELTIVLTVLAALSALVVPVLSETVTSSRVNATRGTLAAARSAMLDYWQDTKLLPMDGVGTVATESNRVELNWLFENPSTGDGTIDFDPNSRIGWRGQYVDFATGDEVVSGTRQLIDSWNNALVVQDPSPSASPRQIRIVSAGPNGVVDIPSGTATGSLTTADIGDDEYVSLMLR